uniref:Uncharacterized protein n=1 Tax=Rhizophora mucronata TaxID=61149 RepID=A0A2P2QMC2_RHIMU
MKEERLKNQSEVGSEVLAWVNRSRKLERKITEMEKAKQLSKAFEELDNIAEGEGEDEQAGHNTRMVFFLCLVNFLFPCLLIFFFRCYITHLIVSFFFLSFDI